MIWSLQETGVDGVSDWQRESEVSLLAASEGSQREWGDVREKHLQVRSGNVREAKEGEEVMCDVCYSEWVEAEQHPVELVLLVLDSDALPCTF